MPGVTGTVQANKNGEGGVRRLGHSSEATPNNTRTRGGGTVAIGESVIPQVVIKPESQRAILGRTLEAYSEVGVTRHVP